MPDQTMVADTVTIQGAAAMARKTEGAIRFAIERGELTAVYTSDEKRLLLRDEVKVWARKRRKRGRKKMVIETEL